MSFGANLESMRRKLGVQIYEFENVSGIPKQRLQDLEAGKVSPTITEVLALSYLFKTTPQVLLDLPTTDEKAKKNQAKTQEAKKPVTPNVAVNNNVAVHAVEGSKKVTTFAEPTKEKEEVKTSQAEDDVTQALQQLQAAGNQSKRVQADPKAVLMDSSKLQQQAMAHVVNVGKAQEVQQTIQESKTVEQPKQNNAPLYVRMKAAREKKNMRYSKITEELGIKLMEYIQYETGMRKPDEELEAKIIKLFQLDD